MELHREVASSEEKEGGSPGLEPKSTVADIRFSLGKSPIDSYPSVIESDENIYGLSVGRYLPQARISKPEKKGRNYFLERIAMQQDCVEDGYEDESTTVGKAGETDKSSDIKNRIAQQLDIGDLSV